jgi:2',3'-cyclic-nucleotide 2'-phosphodiesterase (5'-nucleotidase family)
MNMLRKWGYLCGAILLATLWAGTASAAQGHNVSILYTNDTHGHLQSFFADGNKPVGGVAKRAIYFAEKRRHPGMTWLTLDAGDAISGTPLSDIFNGYLDVEAMNRMHYDAMTLGIHDFDYGVDVLRKRMSEATFPVLSANIVIAKTGQVFSKPYVIIERDGMKFAIFGLTTMEINDQVADGNFRNLTAVDPIETARTLVPKLRQQADMVIGLTHLGVNEDIHLASQVPGIDVIVGGFSHSELQVPMKVGETLIVQDAYYGKNAGLLKLSYARDVNGQLRRVYFDNLLETLDGRWKENSDYLTWLGGYKVQMAERMGTLLGTTHGKFNASKVKSSETEMGNFVADILREKMGADGAILPAAFFRQGLPDGPVTLGDLYEALPYDQYAVALTVSGNELLQIINDAADQIGKPGFPQVSGVSFSIYNGHAPQSTVRVNGEDLDPFGTYTIATSDYIADGGLGYAAMGTVKTRSYSGRLIRDLVRERLSNGQTSTSKLYGRITFLAQEPEGPEEPTVEEEPALASAPPDDETSADTTPDDGFVPDEEAAATDHEAAPDDFSTDETTPETTAPQGGEPEVIDETVTSEPPGGARPEPEAEEETSAPVEDDTAAASDDSGVSLEDEVVSDDDSPAPPAETPPTTSKPASTGALPAEDMLAKSKEIGRATASQGGLDYVFRLLKTDKGYQFRLEVTNASGGPVDMQYSTGKRADFAVYDGTNLLWNYNHNRFFSQAMITDTISNEADGRARNKRIFGGEWNGLTIDRNNVKRGQTYRFEATHFLMDAPVLLSFEAALK